MDSTDNTVRLNERPKKPYHTPTLTDYGTVAQVTQAGNATPGIDGPSDSS